MKQMESSHSTKIKPEIAIIDSNTLSCMGLKNILERIIPMAVIRTFCSFEQLIDDTPDYYFHYFVSAQIYFEHTHFFAPRKHKSIILATGISPQLKDFRPSCIEYLPARRGAHQRNSVTQPECPRKRISDKRGGFRHTTNASCERAYPPGKGSTDTAGAGIYQ